MEKSRKIRHGDDFGENKKNVAILQEVHIKFSEQK
jgi:hypothetical protein